MVELHRGGSATKGAHRSRCNAQRTKSKEPCPCKSVRVLQLTRNYLSELVSSKQSKPFKHDGAFMRMIKTGLQTYLQHCIVWRTAPPTRGLLITQFNIDTNQPKLHIPPPPPSNSNTEVHIMTVSHYSQSHHLNAQGKPVTTPGIQLLAHAQGRHLKKKLINFGHCPKRGGGPTMPEVLSKISYDYKFVYFICSHDREVHRSEQNHQNLKN